MSAIRLPILVFLLVFLSGTALVLCMKIPGKVRKKLPDPPKTEAIRHKLPPLKLPDEKKRNESSGSWEVTGETNTNFVTAKAKFSAELMHQGWRPDKQITLEESITPRILLTFQKRDLELILMLWKIDINTTGFAYKREKIINHGDNAQ